SAQVTPSRDSKRRRQPTRVCVAKVANRLLMWYLRFHQIGQLATRRPAVPVAKLTKSVVERIEPGSILWDSNVKGFGARRQLQGVHYVLKIKNRWHSIGRHGSPWTTETARREAQRLLGQVLNGNDPKDKHSDAFADAVEGFLARQEQRLRPKGYAET